MAYNSTAKTTVFLHICKAAQRQTWFTLDLFVSKNRFSVSASNCGPPAIAKMTASAQRPCWMQTSTADSKFAVNNACVISPSQSTQTDSSGPSTRWNQHRTQLWEDADHIKHSLILDHTLWTFSWDQPTNQQCTNVNKNGHFMYTLPVCHAHKKCTVKNNGMSEIWEVALNWQTLILLNMLQQTEILLIKMFWEQKMFPRVITDWCKVIILT